MNTYAGFWRRAAAFGLDYLIVLAYLLLLTGAGLLANRFLPQAMASLFADPLRGQISGFILVTLPISLYFALSEASAHQATWGKRRLRLQVTRRDGSRLSIGRSLLRTALKFVPWELSHTCIWQISFAAGDPPPLITAGFVLVWVLIGLNAAALIFSKTHQALYDRLADTVVMQTPR